MVTGRPARPTRPRGLGSRRGIDAARWPPIRTIGEPRRARRLLVLVAGLAAAGLVAVAAIVMTSRASSRSDAVLDGDGVLGARIRLLDTPAGDGPSAGADVRRRAGEPVEAGSVLQLPVAGHEGIDGDVIAAALEIGATADEGEATVTAFACGEPQPDLPQVRVPAGGATARQVLSPLGADGDVCLAVDADVHLTVDVRAVFTDDTFDGDGSGAPRRLVDTRPDSAADLAPGAPLAAGSTLEIPVVDPAGDGPDGGGALVLDVTAMGGADGIVTLQPCGARPTQMFDVPIRSGRTATAFVLVPPGPRREVCASTTANVDLVVDLRGVVAADVVRFGATTSLVDTTRGGDTVDDELAGTGVRPAHSTLQVPVTERLTLAPGTEALLVNVTAVQPLDDGDLSVFPPSWSADVSPTLRYRSGETSTVSAIVPIDASGRVCATTSGATDLVLEVVGVITDPDADPDAVPVASQSPVADARDGAPDAGAAPTECPAQELFPHWRMVAMYGTSRSAQLGVLGEQPPEAAAARLERIVRRWERGDRPVLPAFELIATLATADPGEDGLHRLPASDELVQRYLDAARRRGIYLILDLQPGRSDFLTEAQRYERFLREPDVGLALDPEWRTEYPATPGGGYIGSVDGAEVNAVADWLAGIVADAGLPEKLLVVHQFREEMVTDRDQLRAPPGIALTVHMDGHGTRAQKLDSYAKVHAEPPLHNALKLFYDEDVDMFRPRDVLRGAFEPAPELITYQ